MTIFPVFLLASMCLWASAISSRLNVLSITGLKDPEKCGNTLCENAVTSSALYCKGKMGTDQAQLQRRRHRWDEEWGVSSHLKAARAQEAAEQVTSLGQQLAQQFSIDCSASHGAIQHPPAISGQTADIFLPNMSANAVKDDVHTLTWEMITICSNKQKWMMLIFNLMLIKCKIVK